MVKSYEFDENLATIAWLENFLLQKLCQNGKKHKNFRIFRLLLKKYEIYGFYFGRIEKSVVNLYDFDENLDKIGWLEFFVWQKVVFVVKIDKNWKIRFTFKVEIISLIFDQFLPFKRHILCHNVNIDIFCSDFSHGMYLTEKLNFFKS